MRVVVSYDITDNTIRRRVDKVCKAFGQRVQKSVFECMLSGEQLRELTRRLDVVRTTGNVNSSDSIRLYTLCANCVTATSVLGYKPIIATETKHIVI